MSVDLNQEVCALCGTRLTDRSSVVENEGTLYCCRNCLIHAMRPDAALVADSGEHCAYCGMGIVETTTRVQQGIHIYCCNNCANARERALVGRPV
ncbi:MAG: hypothetical protein WCF84_05345 [Anaerolineae bacterium]